MLLKRILLNSLQGSAISIFVLKNAVMASCAPIISFNDTKVFFNKETQEVYTTTGLRFDLPNAGKLIYTQLLQIGQNMVAGLKSQEASPDGKLKCRYEMPLHPLNFEASFDPYAPLPVPPAPSANPAVPGMPMTHSPAQVAPGMQLPYQQQPMPHQ